MDGISEDLFERGRTLFNHGHFFECHEVWEEIWKRSEGEEKLFYQGLIQAAVALLHAERSNLRGALSTYGKARAKLDAFPENYKGIALAELRTGLEGFFSSVLNGGTPLPPPIRRLNED